MLKRINQFFVACINSWVWLPLMQENAVWVLPYIVMGIIILSLMEFQDYEDDVMTFILLATVPLIAGLTLSPQVQSNVAQWGFLGVLGIIVLDMLLLFILSLFWYLVLDYEDFIPFRKE